MSFVDAHVHVWDPAVLDYAWLRAVPDLDRPMLPGDLDRADGAADVVFVESDCRPDQALAEARWAAGLWWPRLRGIVAAADLRSPSLPSHLDALSELGYVVGVRHLLQDEDPASWHDDAALLGGLAAVAARGWTFDACVRWTQLDGLTALLAAIPDLAVVIDHLGKPPVDDGVECSSGRAWAAGLARAAARERTFVKLSGLGAEASDATSLDHHADGFLALALDLFGPERAMLGSDWPVSARLGAAIAPTTWRQRVKRAVAGARGWAAVSSGTAERFYRL